MWCTYGFHVWCTCSAQLSEEFQKIHVEYVVYKYMRFTCFVKKCTYGVHVVHNWCTIGVQLVYIWCTCGLHVVYMLCTCGFHVVYMWGYIRCTWQGRGAKVLHTYRHTDPPTKRFLEELRS